MVRSGGRRRFFSLSSDTTVWEIDRSRIRSPKLTGERIDQMRRPIVPRGSHSGIVQPHLRWLQFAKSNFRSFETITRRSAARVPPIGLRIARDATQRYFRFYCRNRPARSNARTIRRGVMPRINSTVYEDAPAARQRTRVHQRWRAATENSSRRLIRDEPIPRWILIALASSITLSFPRHHAELHGSISLRLRQMRLPNTSASSKWVMRRTCNVES